LASKLSLALIRPGTSRILPSAMRHSRLSWPWVTLAAVSVPFGMSRGFHWVPPWSGTRVRLPSTLSMMRKHEWELTQITNSPF